MELEVQPLLIDQYQLQATSSHLSATRADDPNARIYGITKKEATMNAQFYRESHVNEFTKPKKRGKKPRMWWQPWKFRDQNAKGVSLQSYGAFPIWINGNPTEFQKQDYAQNGHIDIEKNRRERRHEDNYIHTDICNLPPEQIQQENTRYLPHAWEISEQICQNVLGHQPYGYENPNIYTHITLRKLEINQDLLTYPHDSINTTNQLWQYLTSPDGQAHLYDTRCLRMTSTMNTKFAGAAVILTYKDAQLKIYPKTHHGIRIEVMIGQDAIERKMGNKNPNNLTKIIDQIAKPTLKQANIKEILQNQPPAKNITPLILEHIIDDPTILHMAKKTLEHRALTKDEVPKTYRNKGQKHLYRAERTGKEWLYYLRPQLTKDIDWYGGE